MNGRYVVHVCSYAAAYAGNFIAALKALEQAVAFLGLRHLYIFPDSARQTVWAERLVVDGHAVRFMPPTSSVGSAILLESYLRGYDVALVHTHFNRFDVPAWLTLVLSAGRKHNHRWCGTHIQEVYLQDPH